MLEECRTCGWLRITLRLSDPVVCIAPSEHDLFLGTQNTPCPLWRMKANDVYDMVTAIEKERSLCQR